MYHSEICVVQPAKHTTRSETPKKCSLEQIFLWPNKGLAKQSLEDGGSGLGVHERPRSRSFPAGG